MMLSFVLAAFTFYNIAPYSPGQEKELAAAMVDYRDRTGNDLVLYSLTLHPEGVPATEKVDQAVASYRTLKAELEGTGVRLGALLQAILGHWPRSDRETEPWQRAVDGEGKLSRFCSFDPGYRAYISNTVAKIAAERPAFFMGDDDIRAFSPDAECFCPLHLAEINRRLGTAHTSDSLRQAVRAGAPTSPVVRTFMQLQRETVEGVCRLIRGALDAVDPAIPAGTCMPGWELRFNDAAARAIAARGQTPVMRLANAKYLESSLRDFPATVARTQALAAFHAGKGIRFLDEADTFPHNLWSKSAVSLHAKLVAGAFSGITGAKLWYVNAPRRRNVPVNGNYTDVLARYRGHYDALVAALEGTRPAGLACVCYTNFPNWHPVPAWRTSEKMFENRSWGALFAGVCGIPFRHVTDLSEENAVYTLSGAAAVRRLSDGEIRSVFRQKAVVDGEAAVELTKRGFASLLGVEAVSQPFDFTAEKDRELPYEYPFNKTSSTVKLTPDPRAKVLTDLVFSPYRGSPVCDVVAPGTVYFQNACGGDVVVSSYGLGARPWQLMSEVRKEWFLRNLKRLHGPDIPYVVMNPQDVTLLENRGPDDTAVLGVFNLNPDPIAAVRLRCADAPWKIERLGDDGVWRDVPVRMDGKVAVIDGPLPCYGALVLRIPSPIARPGRLSPVGEVPRPAARAAWVKNVLRGEYGEMPAGRPPVLRFERIAPDADAMGGRAVRKTVRVVYGTASSVTNFTFTAFIPKRARPVPSFVHLCNFGRRRNLDPDRKIRTGYWPAETIVARGYAAIGYFANDLVDPYGERPDRAPPGKLAVWAWGASRIMDWVESEPSLDARRVAILGHSRGGKAAIVAGIADSRFAMVCANCSGCGGARLNALALEHSETPERLTAAMPGWFTPAYVAKIRAGESVGFDQHQVLALVAPRLLAVGSATEDVHAGPQGEYLSAVLASPAWEAYGKKGLVTKGFPRVASPEQEGCVSYHLRRGIHTLTPYDWNRYLDFADRHGWRGEDK